MTTGTRGDCESINTDNAFDIQMRRCWCWLMSPWRRWRYDETTSRNCSTQSRAQFMR